MMREVVVFRVLLLHFMISFALREFRLHTILYAKEYLKFLKFIHCLLLFTIYRYERSIY